MTEKVKNFGGFFLVPVSHLTDLPEFTLGHNLRLKIIQEVYLI